LLVHGVGVDNITIAIFALAEVVCCALSVTTLGSGVTTFSSTTRSMLVKMILIKEKRDIPV
jgi:hypothetical protein